jgi:hypothetical protein
MIIIIIKYPYKKIGKIFMEKKIFHRNLITLYMLQRQRLLDRSLNCPNLYMTNLARDGFDFKNVRDFKWHDAFWKESIQPQFSGGSERCTATGWVYDKKKLQDEIFKLGEVLRSRLGFEIAELDVNGSKFFKESWINPPRLGALIKETQVDNSIE